MKQQIYDAYTTLAVMELNSGLLWTEVDVLNMFEILEICQGSKPRRILGFSVDIFVFWEHTCILYSNEQPEEIVTHLATEVFKRTTK